LFDQIVDSIRGKVRAHHYGFGINLVDDDRQMLDGAEKAVLAIVAAPPFIMAVHRHRYVPGDLIIAARSCHRFPVSACASGVADQDRRSGSTLPRPDI